MLNTESESLPQSIENIETAVDPFEVQESPSKHTALECPNCQSPYREGELVCQQCGIMFSNVISTRKLNKEEHRNVERTRRVGEAVAPEMRPICLIVDGQKLQLPLAKSIIIGRQGGSVSDPQPDVDLTRHDAVGRGVSRQHIKIIRSNDLIHVADLASMNGTFLNGFRLIPNQQRLLRDGDELILGRLSVTVKF